MISSVAIISLVTILDYYLYFRPQHLSGLELLRDLSIGRLDGAAVGSTKITFQPKSLESGSFDADTKTAGFVCILHLFKYFIY